MQQVYDIVQKVKYCAYDVVETSDFDLPTALMCSDSVFNLLKKS